MNSILPPNRSVAEEALDLSTARIGAVPVPLADLWTPETCPVAHLAALAAALSVDIWDDAWPESTKRAVITASAAVHRRKGTIGAVKDALRAAGYNEAVVVERFGWEFYDGSYGYDGSITHAELDHWAEYRVVLNRPISVEQADQVRAILGAIAPARCHLKALDFTEALNLYDNSIVHGGAFTHGVA